eukprot:TRINITY_DN46876_c0_g1_i1.p1 TRINITY_DN46876_c0_g1~~TRINITY_DN46876_c0_g1_i1.p1  ORF type:complete len:628 (+),score=176.91 TRINITY_DN46876_c0_g1_i1:69-1886(+)
MAQQAVQAVEATPEQAQEIIEALRSGQQRFQFSQSPGEEYRVDYAVETSTHHTKNHSSGFRVEHFTCSSARGDVIYTVIRNVISLTSAEKEHGKVFGLPAPVIEKPPERRAACPAWWKGNCRAGIDCPLAHCYMPPVPGPSAEQPAQPAEGAEGNSKLLDAVCSGDMPALEQMIGPQVSGATVIVSERYSRGGVSGNLLCLAAFHHRKKVIAYLAAIPGVGEALSHAAMFCVRHCKYDMALLLLAQPQCDVNWQRPTDGTSLLHYACTRPKPPVAFIAELCRVKALRTNARNHAGQTPVHLIALFSKGVEGRDAAQVLRAKGALLDVRDACGRTPLMMCKNSFLREVLGMGSVGGQRQDPSAMLTEEEKERIDSVSSDKIHKEVDKLLRDARSAKDQLREEQFVQMGNSPEAAGVVRRRRRLQQGDVEELVTRLYDQTRAKMEESREKVAKQLEKEIPQGRKLARDEQDESVQRLYGAAEKKSESMAELVAKYTEPSGEPRTLAPEDLTESVTRLCNQSQEKARERREMLREKYLPATLVDKKYGGNRLGKEETKASVARLYDQSMERQGKTLDSLRQKYLVSSPKRQLSPEALQKSVERLTAPK